MVQINLPKNSEVIKVNIIKTKLAQKILEELMSIGGTPLQKKILD